MDANEEARLLQQLLQETEAAIGAECGQLLTSAEQQDLAEQCARKREESRAQADRQVAALPRADGKAVLVVDDSSVMRIRISGVLRKAGLSVVVAEDAEQAEAILAKNATFALMTLDINMPRVDGFSFLRTVRERWPAQPVLMVSAVHDKAIICDALRLGAVGYVTKPFSDDALKAEVLRAVSAGMPA